jgi:pectate lyase
MSHTHPIPSPRACRRVRALGLLALPALATAMVAATASGAAVPSAVVPHAADSVHGYAAVNADGRSTTTGGAGGTTVTVTSLSALETAAASSATETIQVSGLFTGSGEVTVASNKTIRGVGSGSGLKGIGLKFKNVHNDIVQNMNISVRCCPVREGRVWLMIPCLLWLRGSGRPALRGALAAD